MNTDLYTLVLVEAPDQLRLEVMTERDLLDRVIGYPANYADIDQYHTNYNELQELVQGLSIGEVMIHWSIYIIVRSS